MEYLALIEALSYLRLMGRDLACEKSVTIYSDSKLVVEQVNGRWKVKDERMQRLCGLAQSLIPLLETRRFTLKLIPRSKNKEADALVNHILDAYEDK